MVSVGCEFESSLAGRFWFRVSHDVAIGCQLRLQSSEGLTWTGGDTSKVVHSQGCQVGFGCGQRSLDLLHTGSLLSRWTGF